METNAAITPRSPRDFTLLPAPADEDEKTSAPPSLLALFRARGRFYFQPEQVFYYAEQCRVRRFLYNCGIDNSRLFTRYKANCLLNMSIQRSLARCLSIISFMHSAKGISWSGLLWLLWLLWLLCCCCCYCYY
jgi:hypothetical protein